MVVTILQNEGHFLGGFFTSILEIGKFAIASNFRWLSMLQNIVNRGHWINKWHFKAVFLNRCAAPRHVRVLNLSCFQLWRQIFFSLPHFMKFCEKIVNYECNAKVVYIQWWTTRLFAELWLCTHCNKKRCSFGMNSVNFPIFGCSANFFDA